MVLVEAPARPEIFALEFVNAGGLDAQLAFNWLGALVTLTRTVHEPLAGTVTPVTVMLLPPAAALVVATALLQDPEMPGVAATRRLEGKLSVNVMSCVVGTGLFTVKVSTVVAPAAKVVGANDLTSSGQANKTEPLRTVPEGLKKPAVNTGALANDPAVLREQDVPPIDAVPKLPADCGADPPAPPIWPPPPPGPSLVAPAGGPGIKKGGPPVPPGLFASQFAVAVVALAFPPVKP